MRIYCTYFEWITTAHSTRLFTMSASRPSSALKVRVVVVKILSTTVLGKPQITFTSPPTFKLSHSSCECVEYSGSFICTLTRHRLANQQFSVHSCWRKQWRTPTFAYANRVSQQRLFKLKAAQVHGASGTMRAHSSTATSRRINNKEFCQAMCGKQPSVGARGH